MISSADVGSRIMPHRRSRTFTISRNTIGLSVRPSRRLGDRLRDLLPRQDPAEQRRGPDDDHDLAGDDRGVPEDERDVPRTFIVRYDSARSSMYRAPMPAASVGVKKPPRMPPRMMIGAPIGGSARRSARRVAAQLYGSPTRSGLPRDQRKTVDDERQCHEDRRDDGGREQGAGRHCGDRRVHDCWNAGRHDRADERRARAQADREFGRVALLPHVVDLDRADARGIGQRRAAHPRKAEADRDVDVRETGSERTEHEERGVVQPIGDLGSCCHGSDQDEEGHGQQWPAVDPLHHEPDAQVEL